MSEYLEKSPNQSEVGELSAEEKKIYEPDIPIDNSDDTGDDGPFAPLKNVIPLDKLKNGWFTLSSYVLQGSARVQEKIIETYNSEQVQNFKQKTVETVVPVWEKTCEAATPVWEQTKLNASIMAENIKPTIDNVAELTVNGANAAYHSFSDSLAQVTKSFSDGNDSHANPQDTGGSGESYTPSVLDQATRGGPMTV